MRTHLAIALWLCLPVTAGCSAMMTTVDAGVDSGVPMPSMLTASGMLTGTVSAQKPIAGYDAQGNTGSFLLSTMTAMQPFKVDINVEFTGAPAALTYTSASPGFTCNTTITSGTAAADTWVALFNSTAGANKGTCSLTFSSVMMSGAGYQVAGTLDITAQAQGGASSGMVTLTGTF